MTVDYAKALADSRATGRAAGRAHIQNGVLPVPPASISDGSLLMRKCASAWYAGLAEGRSAGPGPSPQRYYDDSMPTEVHARAESAPYGLNDLFAGLRTAETPVASTVPQPHGKPGGGLWGHPGLMAPPYIEHVAGRLMEQGHPESEAYHMAVGIVENWKNGHDGHGNKVHPDVQAAASKNIAQWEALKARYGGGKRFNPFHAPPGPGGGEFSSGGGGGSGSSPGGAGGHAKAKAVGDAVKKHHLLQRAKEDRARAHQLEDELKTLEHQLHTHQQAAAAAAHAQKQAAAHKQAAAKAGKKGGAATKSAKAAAAKTKAKHTAVHHHTGHHHTAAHHNAKAASLKSRISDLRSRISDLLAQADHLTAQAKAL